MTDQEYAKFRWSRDLIREIGGSVIPLAQPRGEPGFQYVVCIPHKTEEVAECHARWLREQQNKELKVREDAMLRQVHRGQS